MTKPVGTEHALALLRQVVEQLPAGELRSGQAHMAATVAEALREGHSVAIGAGTGTGKSLAYLVPAVASGGRVVVATATKALQDQLATKDLPLVAKGLGRPVKWAVLKGRSNYLCRQRLVELERLGEQQELDVGADAPPVRSTRARGRPEHGGAAAVGEEIRRLVEWAETTAEGERSELDFEPSRRAWSSVSVGADECPGARRCPSGSTCFAEAARARAAVSDVIVVNLHLYGAHLRSGGEVLPDHDALVIDEAHELEDVLAASLGTEVSPGRLRALASLGRSAFASLGVAASRTDRSGPGRAVDAVLDSAAKLEDQLSGADDKRLPAGLGPELRPTVELAAGRLDRLASELRRAAAPEHEDQSGLDGSGDTVQRSVRAVLAVDRAREELRGFLTSGDGDVVWATGRERPALHCAPLDVSGAMSELAFSAMPVILTSATLPKGLTERLGAPGSTKVVQVGSPFDYQANGLVYCAVDLPDRRSPDAEAAVHDELESLVLAAGGRTLALFTSRRAMRSAADALAPRLPWPVLVQDDAPKAALLDALSQREAACLFATMSFWQGVDVPGPALTLVVIDKIPFPRPDDPLMAARREAAGAAGFRSVDLPRAATLLAQGAGRLIRASSDRGVVAVLDPRLAKASYGPALVAALPPMRRTRDRAEAEAFLRMLHKDALAKQAEAG